MRVSFVCRPSSATVEPNNACMYNAYLNKSDGEDILCGIVGWSLLGCEVKGAGGVLEWLS